MSHTNLVIDLIAGGTFDYSGFAKITGSGTWSAYAQLFNDQSGTRAKIADLLAELTPVEEPPAAPYAAYTHVLRVYFEGDTSGWPPGKLKTNLLFVNDDAIPKRVPSNFITVSVSLEGSEVNP
jgi:hypothetical protein